jgi:hypothetical protein
MTAVDALSSFRTEHVVVNTEAFRLIEEGIADHLRQGEDRLLTSISTNSNLTYMVLQSLKNMNSLIQLH